MGHRPFLALGVWPLFIDIEGQLSLNPDIVLKALPAGYMGKLENALEEFNQGYFKSA
jgi:hypothetical protein